MAGFPSFTDSLEPAIMVSCLERQAESRGCQKQQTRMLSSSFSMRILSKLALASALCLPLATPANAAQCGQASWYGPGFYGNLTANGEVYRRGTMTAAHPTLPMGTWVRVRNKDNGRVADVRINDRGPYVGGRIIDLGHGAASQLGVTESGLANVCVSRL